MSLVIRSVLFFLIPWGLLSCFPTQKMVNYNVSYIYHPERAMVKKKVFYEKDSLRIYVSYTHFIEFQGLTKEDFSKNYKFLYRITSDHTSSEVLESDSIEVSLENVYKEGKTFGFYFRIPKPASLPSVIMVYKKDLHRNRIEVIDIPLDKTASLSCKYEIRRKGNNHPVLDSYLSKEDTILFSSDNFPVSPLFISLNRNESLPASPPMENVYEEEQENPHRDSLFVVSLDQELRFKTSGLYYIQKDTLSEDGFSLLVKDYKYPVISKAEEMIEPLIYLTNLEEQQAMRVKPNPKSTLDSFWLKIGGSKEYSKEMIRTYYQKVEYTNRIFTSYKEGWKTDRGMIYIIFGKPDQVYIWNDKEEWVYENILTHVVSFLFVKKNNAFTDNHYELVRNPYYEPYWNITVEKWKNGIITK